MDGRMEGDVRVLPLICVDEIDGSIALRVNQLACTAAHSDDLQACIGPFGCADKPAEKHCWLICCERKILFRLKIQAEKDGL
jgi:hypothetical protein